MLIPRPVRRAREQRSACPRLVDCSAVAEMRVNRGAGNRTDATTAGAVIEASITNRAMLRGDRP